MRRTVAEGGRLRSKLLSVQMKLGIERNGFREPYLASAHGYKLLPRLLHIAENNPIYGGTGLDEFVLQLVSVLVVAGAGLESSKVPVEVTQIYDGMFHSILLLRRGSFLVAAGFTPAR